MVCVIELFDETWPDWVRGFESSLVIMIEMLYDWDCIWSELNHKIIYNLMVGCFGICG